MPRTHWRGRLQGVGKSGRNIVFLAGPVRTVRGSCFGDQDRFLNRQLSLPVSTMSQ